MVLTTTRKKMNSSDVEDISSTADHAAGPGGLGKLLGPAGGDLPKVGTSLRSSLRLARAGLSASASARRAAGAAKGQAPVPSVI